MSRYLRRPFEDLGEGPTRPTYRYPDPDLNSGINHRAGEGINTWNVFAGGRGYSNDTRSVWCRRVVVAGRGSRERVGRRKPIFHRNEDTDEIRGSSPPRTRHVFSGPLDRIVK